MSKGNGNECQRKRERGAFDQAHKEEVICQSEIMDGGGFIGGDAAHFG